MSTTDRYRRIPCPIDLCEVAIEQAVHMGLPPAYVYELHVGERLATSARALIQNHMAWKGPLAPLVNLHVDEALDPLEWFIESHGVAIGCRCI